MKFNSALFVLLDGCCFCTVDMTCGWVHSTPCEVLCFAVCALTLLLPERFIAKIDDAMH